MALVYFDRIKEATSTIGTGALLLGGARPGGYRTFASVMVDGDTCYCTTQNTGPGEWEVGLYTYSASTNSLIRTTIQASVIGPIPVPFSAGSKDVAMIHPADRIRNLPYKDQQNLFLAPQTLPVQDQGGQVYNVKAYGAKGDGTTDDTAAIQATLNTTAGTGGGMVYLPPGRYRITGTITIPSFCILQGAVGGNATTRTGTTVIDATALANATAFSGGSASQQIALADLLLLGPAINTVPGSSSVAINPGTGTLNVNVSRVAIQGFRYGISLNLVSVFRLADVTVNAAAQYGFYCLGCQAGTLTNCSATNIAAGTADMFDHANLVLHDCASIIVDAPAQGAVPSNGSGRGYGILVRGSQDVSIRCPMISLISGAYGVRVMDGTNTLGFGLHSARVHLYDINIASSGPYTPVNTLTIDTNQTSCVLENITTNPGSGGDISDAGTGTSWINVNSISKLGKTTGTFLDLGGQVHNVLAYGAVGDGSTDDTVAIQAALSALPVTGGTLFFPPLTYKVTSTLLIHGKEGINLVAGKGNNDGSTLSAVLLWAGATNGTCLHIDGVTHSRFEGIWVDGNSLACGTGILVESSSPVQYYTQNNEYLNVGVRECQVGVQVGIVGANQSENSEQIWWNLELNNNTVGFYLPSDQAAHQWFYNVQASNNGTALKTGAAFPNSGHFTIKNASFGANTLDLDLPRINGPCLIEGMSTEATTNYSIYCDAVAEGSGPAAATLTLRNCTFSGGGKFLHYRAASDLLVEGCFVSGNQSPSLAKLIEIGMPGNAASMCPVRIFRNNSLGGFPTLLDNADGSTTCNYRVIIEDTGTANIGGYTVAYEDVLVSGNAPVYGPVPLMLRDSAGNTNTMGFGVPLQSAPSSSGGGSLAAGTYYYVITHQDLDGAESFPSGEKSITVGSSSRATLTWSTQTTCPGSNVRIYRGTTAGGESVYFTASAAAGTFTDTGAAGTAGTPPNRGLAYLRKIAAMTGVEHNIASAQVDGGIQTNAVTLVGLTGATSQARYVGGTVSGAPVSGTFAVRDVVVDASGAVWVCTSAGTPGTWAQVGGSGGPAGYYKADKALINASFT